MLKIRLISFVGPKIVEMDDERIVIRVKHKKRNLNHLGSIYLGALVVGADLAAGFQAFMFARNSDKKISLVFKDIHGDFISRPDSDAYFISNEGSKIKEMVARSETSGERVTEGIDVSVVVSYPHAPEEVARFTLGLSLKVK